MDGHEQSGISRGWTVPPHGIWSLKHWGDVMSDMSGCRRDEPSCGLAACFFNESC